MGEAMRIHSILEVYERASGQKINYQKSEVFFSKNTSQLDKDAIATQLDVSVCMGTGKYLGLPSMVGRSKKALFKFIKDRIWRKINSWGGRMLSKAGKEVMIKSVLQSIPTYFMSLFLIPSTLIDEIERLLNGFWWGGSGNRNKGIRWMSWSRLCVPKGDGGLGFRNLKAFNLALLGKQAWRLQSQPDLLVSRLYKAKYFPHCDVLSASKRNNGSFVWNSIIESQPVLHVGASWSIGTGVSIPLFDKKWTAGRVLVKPRQSHLYNPLLRVDYVMNSGSKAWNEPLVHFLFDDNSCNAILNTHLFPCINSDSLCWTGEKSGSYSVRSAYRLALENVVKNPHLRVDGNWNLLWGLKLPPKVKSFLWRFSRNCLPVRAVLAGRGMAVPLVCPCCGDADETTGHLFADCASAIVVWRALGLHGVVSGAAATAVSANSFFFQVVNQLNDDARMAFCMTLWSIWSSRNQRVWNNISDTAATIVRRGNQFLQDWKTAQVPSLRPTTMQPASSSTSVSPG